MSDSGSAADDQEIFIKNIKEWYKINEEITELKQLITPKNKKKKQLSENIMHFMKHTNKKICSLGNAGIIELKVSKRTQTLNKKSLEEILIEYFKSSTQEQQILSPAEKAKACSEYILSNRKKNELSSLKHSNNVLE